MSYEIKINDRASDHRSADSGLAEDQHCRHCVSSSRERGRVSLVTGALVLTAVILLSTVTIRASDEVGSLLAGAGWSQPDDACPEGMVYVSSPQGSFCADSYPAASSGDCTYQDPSSARHSEENINDDQCRAVSEPDRIPWRFITRQQAETACRRAGKRLPSAYEWYRLALGTGDFRTQEEACYLSKGSPQAVRSDSSCRSSSEVLSAVGNVWEWVMEDVNQGVWNGRSLPESGYVTESDSAGVPTKTGDDPSSDHYNSRFWVSEQEDEVQGMIRGGYHGSGSDGGVYALNATIPLSFTGRAVGFRCVAEPYQAR